MTQLPDECVAPVLTLNLPAPISIPHNPLPIQLHMEYTRIDRELDSSDPGSDKTTTVQKAYNASILTQSPSLVMALDNLPYVLLSWEAYVVRMRLEVLGEFSRKWSNYSQPFCVHCRQCKSHQVYTSGEGPKC